MDYARISDNTGLKTSFLTMVLRFMMAAYTLLLRAATLKAGKSRRSLRTEAHDILLTGTFYSDNWIIPHLQPLGASPRCRRLRMVASNPVPSIPKVEAVYAPAWLSKLVGKVPARLLLFLWIAIREKPDIVGGFHILPNGLLAALAARLVSAKSLYICGGGPRELVGGGYLSGNRVFGRIPEPDPVIERHLLHALSEMDLIITMGSKAVTYFGQHLSRRCHIVPGGFSTERFHPATTPSDHDLILVGRLSSIKRVDIFLHAVKLCRQKIAGIRAIVVGDGPDRAALEQMAERIGIGSNVKFVGHQDNVADWLRRAKIFVLTSDSEGLAQAMIQAMLCGLPAVVSDVGDLGDLVDPGVNGYLVRCRTPTDFAERFTDILTDPELLSRLGKAAKQTASKFEMENVTRSWNEILHPDAVPSVTGTDDCIRGNAESLEVVR